MRHLIKSILFCFLLYNQTLGQWTIQNTPTTSRLRGMVFTDANNGWADGYGGTILHTTNGGTDWNLENSNTSQDLFTIQFPSADTGFAFGENGTILKYSGGEWAELPSITNNRLYSSHFIDNDHGWASGLNETLIRTTDGGNSWQRQSVTHENVLHSIYFLNSNYGWAVTEGTFDDGMRYGILFKTTDGGINWTQKFILSQYLFHSVFFINQTTGWIAGSNGLVLRTDDGGNSWSYQYPPTLGWLYSIFFINQNQGWVVGNTGGIIYYTNNGGYSWNENYSGVTDWLTSIQFIDQNVGWASGDNGRILHTINGGIPVELISFKAESESDDVILSWFTATETNNRGFEIERKKENEEFENIGFVEGYGTTTQTKTYIFNDKKLLNGKYFYRLKQIDFDGSFKYSKEVKCEINIPIEFNLEQNYPNPFNPTTTIDFTLPNESKIKLEIFNLLGQKVATLADNYMKAGNHSIIFNAIEIPSGIYYYRLSTDSFNKTKKLIVLK